MSVQRNPAKTLSRRQVLVGGTGLLALSACQTDQILSPQALIQESLGLAQTFIFDMEVSEQDEIAIGNRLYGRLVDTYGGPYRNRKVQSAMQRFADPLIRSGGRRSLPWEVTVLDDDTVNAWALPGGKLAINKGLLRYVASDAELAAVLAHEIGHVELSHVVGEMRTGRFTDALTNRGRAVLQSLIYDPNVSQLTDLAIDEMAPAIRAVVTAGYSRSAEHEADAHILTVFDLAGYEPTAAAGFFRTLLQLYPPDSDGTTSLFSTHPGTRARIAALEAAAAGRPSPSLPAASRGYAEIKQTFPTRRYFRRRPLADA